jgi:hypothetical protein
MTKEDNFIKVTVNMPKSHHRKLKAIAALKDMGLSAYIMKCVEKVTLRQKDTNDKEVSEDDAVKEVEELIEAQS